MWELRNAVKQLLKELCVNQTELREKLKEKCGYNITSSDMSNYLTGVIETPKSRRVLMDSLQILVDMQDEMKALIAKAQG